MPQKENTFEINWQWLKQPETRQYVFVFLTILAALLLIYKNSFHCEFHFDDFRNISENKNIKIKSLNWKELKKTFRGKADSKSLNRPLAYFTFALNYHFNKTDVFGYHLVNFVIHYLSSVFLILLFFNILKLPSVGIFYQKNRYAISLLAVFLWATHPIQVSSVTYIVQRMASMAAMFYFLSMYFYIKGRTSENTQRKGIYFCFFLVSAVLSMASKENAAMLPIILILMELLLIQKEGFRRFTPALNLIIALFFLVALFAFAYANPFNLLGGYAHRPFTPIERLLTQSRVLLFYISLMLYPASSRFMLLHDVDISHGLFDPVTTLYAIVGIVLIIGVAVLISRKQPLISFCIFFYFINHLIESTIIPLELIYEHRNYLPGAFIFLLVSIFAVKVLDYFSYRKSIQWLAAVCITIFLVAQGHTVHMRNNVFSTAETLWKDNLEKAPNSSRAHGKLAEVYFSRGDYQKAAAEFEMALNLAKYHNTTEPFLYHLNLGYCYLTMDEKEGTSLFHFQKVLSDFGPKGGAYDGVAMVRLSKGDLDQAMKNSKKAIMLEPENPAFHNNYALVMLKKGLISKAINHAQRALLLDINFAKPYAILGEAYRKKGNYPEAVAFWEKYSLLDPLNLNAHLALIYLYNETHNNQKLKTTIGSLLLHSKSKKIENLIKGARRYVYLQVYIPNNVQIGSIIKNYINNEFE